MTISWMWGLHGVIIVIKECIYSRAGTINRLINNQSILNIFSDYRLQICNIDYVKKTYFGPHFKHTTANNVQFGASLVIKWEEFPALIDLIGLITSANFNRLLIDLKLVIIDFRISADSQPYYKDMVYIDLFPLLRIMTSLGSKCETKLSSRCG